MELTNLRNNIDAIDNEMIRLFGQRMEICREVAELKQEKGLAVEDKNREREVISRISQLAGEEMDSYARMLYSLIFDVSRSYQSSLYEQDNQLTRQIREALSNQPQQFPKRGTVACAGMEGSYSQIAADKLFSMADIMYFRNFDGVFQAVDKGLCDFGVLPIENSTGGSVNNVYDLLHRHNCYIVRSIRLHINHILMTKQGVALSNIKEIVSHEQAISQCSNYLAAHPKIKITICENTAAAAKMVAESTRDDIAALCSESCAHLYGLSGHDEPVQNCENNYTRFICIAKEMIIYPGADRISLMLTLPHTSGSLYHMIMKFAALGLNLTKLESRPRPGRDFEFLFYFDIDASVLTKEVLRLLGECASSGELFVFLGNYSEVR